MSEPDLYDPKLHQEDGHGGCVICLFYVPHTDDDTVRQQWPCAIVREAAHPADSAEALLRDWLDWIVYHDRNKPCSWCGQTAEMGGHDDRCLVTRSRAALQASAPSPAAEPPTWCVDPLEHGRFCPCPIPAAADTFTVVDAPDGHKAVVVGAAAEGSEPLDVELADVSLIDLGNGWYRFTADANTRDVEAIGRAAAGIERELAAYASQTEHDRLLASGLHECASDCQR